MRLWRPLLLALALFGLGGMSGALAQRKDPTMTGPADKKHPIARVRTSHGKWRYSAKDYRMRRHHTRRRTRSKRSHSRKPSTHRHLPNHASRPHP
jgi:hypothetical protein